MTMRLELAEAARRNAAFSLPPRASWPCHSAGSSKASVDQRMRAFFGDLMIASSAGFMSRQASTRHRECGNVVGESKTRRKQ